MVSNSYINEILRGVPSKPKKNSSTLFPSSAESYENGVDFVDGLEAICGAGDPSIKEGLCIYTYLANKGMTGRYLTSSILCLICCE
jgi:homogentisate 1,2-dioxygenase